MAAESLVRNAEPLFVRPEFVDKGEGTGKDLGDEQDEISTAYSTALSMTGSVALAELDRFGLDILQ